MTTKKILLVEDEEVIRRLCCRVLTNAEQEIQAVGNVSDAMATLASGEMDLLITDIRLPDGNGFDVLNRFRERFPGRPVIVITGWSAFEERLKPLANEIQCLDKPFKPSDLCEAVKNAFLAKSGRRDAA